LDIVWLLRRAISKTHRFWQKRFFFDIAILDINIAGSSIAPVATIIARRGLPFFFVSGYGLAGGPEAFIERPALQKPVSKSILGETINAILVTAGKASPRADDSSPNIQ